ncbi:hypothetical protein PR048_031297 [Dryococelus australis]|uniref:Uncharacterized protein n=1 Tax=Dryococelus australis TaxID=614101 RepID=A0ABQ9G4V1_9NEOP|nr:hypothetical protein PR048_031297 [Dryococelus australis]
MLEEVWGRNKREYGGKGEIKIAEEREEAHGNEEIRFPNKFSIPGRVTPDSRMWGSCRTMPLVDGFSRRSPVSPGASPYTHQSPSSALKTPIRTPTPLYGAIGKQIVQLMWSLTPGKIPCTKLACDTLSPVCKAQDAPSLTSLQNSFGVFDDQLQEEILHLQELQRFLTSDQREHAQFVLRRAYSGPRRLILPPNKYGAIDHFRAQEREIRHDCQTSELILKTRSPYCNGRVAVARATSDRHAKASAKRACDVPIKNGFSRSERERVDGRGAADGRRRDLSVDVRSGRRAALNVMVNEWLGGGGGANKERLREFLGHIDSDGTSIPETQVYGCSINLGKEEARRQNSEEKQGDRSRAKSTPLHRTVSLLASHQGDPGSIPSGSLRIFTCENCAEQCRWSVGFLGDLPFYPSFRSGSAPYAPQSPSSALKTSMSRNNRPDRVFAELPCCRLYTPEPPPQQQQPRTLVQAPRYRSNPAKTCLAPTTLLPLHQVRLHFQRTALFKATQPRPPPFTPTPEYVFSEMIAASARNGGVPTCSKSYAALTSWGQDLLLSVHTARSCCLTLICLRTLATHPPLALLDSSATRVKEPLAHSFQHSSSLGNSTCRLLGCVIGIHATERSLRSGWGAGEVGSLPPTVVHHAGDCSICTMSTSGMDREVVGQGCGKGSGFR